MAAPVERQRSRPWQEGLNAEKAKIDRARKKEEFFAEATRCKLKVVVRVRPARGRSSDLCVHCEDRIGPWVSVSDGPKLQFTTAVLGPSSSQRHASIHQHSER